MLYKNLARLLRLQIQQGGLRPGERLPSIRQLAASHQVSTATAVQACLQLEREGLAEARPRIGYFVRVAGQGLISTVPPPRAPALISNPALLDLLQVDDNATILPLHAARPAPSLLPDTTIAAALSRSLRRHREQSLGYAPPQGESVGQLQQRVHGFVSEARHAGLQRAVLVTHAGVMKVIVGHAQGLPAKQWMALKFEYESVVCVTLDGG